MKSPIRGPMVYRGSKRRVRRIRMRDNWTPAMWLLFGAVAVALFGLMPWLIRHPL